MHKGALRLATPDDVAAHRALFCLNDSGAKPDDRPLPITATLTCPGQLPEIVLIVQAERDSTGKVHGSARKEQTAEAAEDRGGLRMGEGLLFKLRRVSLQRRPEADGQKAGTLRVPPRPSAVKPTNDPSKPRRPLRIAEDW
jgi:hypothetical protein